MNVGDKVAFIGGEGEAAPEKEETKKKAKKPEAEKKEEKKAQPKKEEKAEAEKLAQKIDKGEEARVKASPVARRVAAELRVDLGSVKGTGPDGRVTETDVRASAQSKTAAAQKAAPSMKTDGGMRINLSGMRKIIRSEERRVG